MNGPPRTLWGVLAGVVVVASLAWIVAGGMPSRTATPSSGSSPTPDSSSTRDATAVTDRGGAAAPRSAGAVPVLLVPGWLDTARDLAAMRIRLLGAGWPADYVETLSFEEPTGSNRTHADELARAVDSLLARTGAGELDIVAHSMGGLATRWYLQHREDAPVQKVVFIASPHRGTLAAHLAWGEGRDEMMPDSPFLDTLNAGPPVPEDVRAITVRTLVETHIVPGESATLPGIPDYELCCPTHAGLIRDEEVFQIVLDFLERG